MNLFKFTCTSLRSFLGLLVGLSFLVAARTQAWASCTLGKVAELPVTMSGARALISAKVNGEDVVFLVDSYAFYSVISAGTASALHLPLSPMPTSYGVKVGRQQVDSIATVKEFSISRSSFSNLDFMVSKSEIDTEVGGRLGLNILDAKDIEYDFSKSIINLLSTKGCDGVDLAYWTNGKPYAMAKIEIGDPLHPQPIAVGVINDVKIHVGFNTAIPRSLISVNAARRLSLNVDSPKKETFKKGNNLVVDGEEKFASIKQLNLGEEKITNISLPVGDFNNDTDMLLGMDFFLSHHVLVAKSQNRVYFSYEGGPVFAKNPTLQDQYALTSNTVATADGLASTNADELSRHGAFLVSRQQYDKAITELTKASELAPDNADYEYQLAAALMAEDQKALAVADLNKAIELKPDDAKALLWRALLRRHDKDQSGELIDLTTLSRTLPVTSYLRLTLGTLYLAADKNDAAVLEFTHWIDSYPEDSRRPLALNQRCWARAEVDRELDEALSDCNRAIGLTPTPNASFFDSRGLVRLRRSEFNRAIFDYDRALKLSPKIAWSLYGRGLAELKTGEADKGRSDIAAATALDAKLPARAAKLGLTPEAFGAASTVASAPTAAAVHQAH